MNKAIPGRIMGLLLGLLLAVSVGVTAFAAGETVKLKKAGDEANSPFAVENMFPGDTVTKDFTVKVTHRDPITLYYHADIHPGCEKLAEVLMVRIELPEKQTTLYDGLMRDMPAALEQPLAADEKQVLYRITAWLDTSVGNDYQYQALTADFRWWYAEEPAPDTPVVPGGGAATGDDSPVLLYALLAGGAVVLLMLLVLFRRRRNEEEQHEQ